MNRSAKDIFLDAIDLPVDRRMEYVYSQTDDPAVRAAAIDLLAAHAVAPTLQPARLSAAASLDEIKPGEVIGDYTLVRKLGEGAFGMVYLARQTEPVVRDVAIKLLKHGHDSRQIVARFEGERQALALMDHPHIARIYDAGETATGRPYFVMEYVAGEPITDYCRRRALALSAQLELFSQVCLAIQHAHQKGVIHRDLKPSNILVSELDGAANPKVIDFGIAKALDVEHLPSITVEAQILGTPQYMSPEQATFDRANVDTRSDVYSLGTVLYELLVGAPPFDPAELQTAGLESMCRVIREKPPARPSTRVAEALRAPKPITTLLSPPSVELDWIVLKALEKEPSRRYQTTADLAADLDRFLRHKPVLAGPPSRIYQLRKFIRRHRIETAAAAVVMLALVGTAIVSLVMASRARKAEADARSELTRAQAVSDFTETVLGGVAPATARGRDTTLLKELLAEAAAEVPEITKDHPGVEAFVRGMIGKAYADLAQDQEALKQYEIAYAAGKSAREADLPGVYRTNMRYAMVLSARGRDDEARRILGEIIDGYNALPGDWTQDKLEVMVNLAAIHLDTGRTQDAEAMLARVLELNQQAKSPNAQLGMIAQNNLAIARLRLGKTADALKTWEGLLVFQRKYIGDDHPNTLGTLNNLASAHEMLDQDAEAEKYYREALATKRRILPAGHQSLIRSIQNLGQHLAAKNQLEEASALLDEAMELCRKHLGNEHDLTYSVMLRVSRLRIKQKRIDEAIALGSEVRQGYGKLYAESDARAVQATMLLLLTYLDTGRHAEGAALWREIESKGYIADQTADTRIKLYSAAAGLLDGTGDRAAALAWFERAKALADAPGVASDGISRFKKVAARFEAATRPG